MSVVVICKMSTQTLELCETGTMFKRGHGRIILHFFAQ